MKKSYSWLAALVLGSTAVLSACGAGGESGTDANGQAAPAAEQPAEGTNASTEDAAKPEPFTLKVSGFLNDEHSLKYYDAVKAKYEELHPEATVELQITEGEKYFDKLRTQLAASDAADVIFNQQVKEFAKAGFFADLSDQPWVERMHDRESMSIGGKVYGVALDLSAGGVLYNKKIFADLGIAPPSTWAEFLAACEKIKASGIVPIEFGVKDEWVANNAFSILFASLVSPDMPDFGERLLDGTAKVNGPEYRKVLEAFIELSKNDYINKNALSSDYAQSTASFADGKAAMVINGNFVAGDAGVKEKIGDQLGAFAFPNENGNPRVYATGNYMVSVNQNSKHLDAAKEFVSLLLDKELLKQFLEPSERIAGISGVDPQLKSAALADFNAAISKSGTINVYKKVPPSVEDGYTKLVIKSIATKELNDSDLEQLQKDFDADKALLEE